MRRPARRLARRPLPAQDDPADHPDRHDARRVRAVGCVDLRRRRRPRSSSSSCSSRASRRASTSRPGRRSFRSSSPESELLARGPPEHDAVRRGPCRSVRRIAGLVLAAYGAGVAFFVNAVTFLLVLGALLLIHPRPVPSPTTPGAVWQHFREAVALRAATAGLLDVRPHDLRGVVPRHSGDPARARARGRPVRRRQERRTGFLVAMFGVGRDRRLDRRRDLGRPRPPFADDARRASP